jgi:nucleotide-binding universal stress UspA family protein
MFKHILIPTDGSDLSNRAVAAGIELAKKARAKVTGLFVAPPATPVIYGKFMPVGYMSPDEHAELIERTAKEYLGVIKKAAKQAGVTVECVTVTSDFPADEIVKAADERNVDLIFMASHGRRGVQALLLGSETQKVLTHTSRPVLVYR